MVTIKNKQQKWVITEKEYQDNKATWDSRGEVTFDVKDPIIEFAISTNAQDYVDKWEDSTKDIKTKIDPEVLIEQKEVSDNYLKDNPDQKIKPKNAKKKAKQ